ncbi:MAG: hypothetical protein HGA85_04850 [Nanoarchaeota archaeon]|nr:hypothetical protein [Nanoarchaeota archaeon]
MAEDIKTELLKILTPIFGKDVQKLIQDNYDSSKPDELIALAHHMLSGYMGEDNANKKLTAFLSRFPKLKLRID